MPIFLASIQTTHTNFLQWGCDYSKIELHAAQIKAKDDSESEHGAKNNFHALKMLDEADDCSGSGFPWRCERAPRARSGPLCMHLPRRSAARSVTWRVLSLMLRKVVDELAWLHRHQSANQSIRNKCTQTHHDGNRKYSLNRWSAFSFKFFFAAFLKSDAACLCCHCSICFCAACIISRLLQGVACLGLQNHIA